MSANFAVGFGAGGDSVDPLDFAKEALSRVSQIAVDLGARKKLCFAGCLAAELLIARKALDAADASQLPKLQRRVPKLLDDLERVCVVGSMCAARNYLATRETSRLADVLRT